MQYDLIVIGSGPAGQKAAIAAAKQNRRVAIIERERELLGRRLPPHRHDPLEDDPRSDPAPHRLPPPRRLRRALPPQARNHDGRPAPQDDRTSARTNGK